MMTEWRGGGEKRQLDRSGVTVIMRSVVGVGVTYLNREFVVSQVLVGRERGENSSKNEKE